jgi:hypothetical protein
MVHVCTLQMADMYVQNPTVRIHIMHVPDMYSTVYTVQIYKFPVYTWIRCNAVQVDSHNINVYDDDESVDSYYIIYYYKRTRLVCTGDARDDGRKYISSIPPPPQLVHLISSDPPAHLISLYANIGRE